MLRLQFYLESYEYNFTWNLVLFCFENKAFWEEKYSFEEGDEQMPVFIQFLGGRIKSLGLQVSLCLLGKENRINTVLFY